MRDAAARAVRQAWEGKVSCVQYGLRGGKLMWREVQPDAQASPLAELFQRSSFVFAVRALQVLRERNLVLVRRSCIQSMMNHLRSRKTELGGLMLGVAYVPRELGSTVAGSITVIEDTVQSDECRTTSVSLTMNTEVWDKARQKLGQSKQIVGWYHSHPNLGAFFSGTDRNTQRSFFNHPYSVGLVIDPLRDEKAWFVGPDSVQLDADCVKAVDE